MLTIANKNDILNLSLGKADFLCQTTPQSMRGMSTDFPNDRRNGAFLLEDKMVKISKRKYLKIHLWLRLNFGNAYKCDNPKCKKITNNFGWALLKGKKYEYKRENYCMFCKSCHTLYDQTEIGKYILSQKMMGNMQGFRKGMIPWNKGKHPEYMQGKNHPMYGKHHTKEASFKISEGLKGKIPWNKGIPCREETKRKLSIIKKQYYQNLKK